jgi:hypothetical protein
MVFFALCEGGREERESDVRILAMLGGLIVPELLSITRDVIEWAHQHM